MQSKTHQPDTWQFPFMWNQPKCSTLMAYANDASNTKAGTSSSRDRFIHNLRIHSQCQAQLGKERVPVLSPNGWADSQTLALETRFSDLSDYILLLQDYSETVLWCRYFFLYWRCRGTITNPGRSCRSPIRENKEELINLMKTNKDWELLPQARFVMYPPTYIA